ncbi:hypothetical protein KEM60_01091 [Austwickia sp. TVS 96-490-7B]|nr:hypothetical protein [Austwickia sp. TVS 96-490-7B]
MWTAGWLIWWAAPRGDKGAAPAGGTTGAANAPNSGGEELVRCAQPEGSAGTSVPL